MKSLALLMLAVPFLADHESKTYYIGHHEKFVNITFESDAEIETIVGHTNVATGQVILDAEAQTGSVSLRVPVASLKTGIDARDEHLQGKWWLDAESHPDIEFASTEVEFDKDNPKQVKVTGNFTMHGQTREVSLDVKWRVLSPEAVKKAKFPEGDWIKCTGSFEVKLSDFGVQIPKMALGKVSDTISIKLALYAGTAKPRTE